MGVGVQELLSLPPEHREIRLLEYQRMDFLTPTERRIYAHNMIKVSSSRAIVCSSCTGLLQHTETD